MARKVRKTPGDDTSDDDAPEIVSRSTSKADAKRSQKALRDFEADEKARKKARNRERDQKLKERTRATKRGGTGERRREVQLGDENRSVNGVNGGEGDDLEARMLRAMRDAAEEVGSAEGEIGSGDDEDDDEFAGFGEKINFGSGSSIADDEDEDTEMSLGEGDQGEALTDDDEMSDDEEVDKSTLFQQRSSSKANYLADDLFAAAFASQSTKPIPKKNTGSTQQQTEKIRRRKPSVRRPKDLVIGGRTIRTLPALSDPQSQATARTLPSARSRRFVDRCLALKGKHAVLKAKKKGWERRPANVGVMKYQGAPHGFARSTG